MTISSGLSFVLCGLIYGISIAFIDAAFHSLHIPLLLCFLTVSVGLMVLQWIHLKWQFGHCLTSPSTASSTSLSGNAANSFGSFSDVVKLGEWCGISADWFLWKEVRAIQHTFHTLSSAQKEDSISLLSCLSHELNTNLHAILGAVQVLSSAEADQQLLRVVSHAASVMTNMVRDFMDLSQCQNGQLRLTPKSIDLHGLANQIQRKFEAEAKRQHIELVVQISSNDSIIVEEGTALTQMVGDYNRLLQVLTNLLCNGFQAVQGIVRAKLVSVSIDVDLPSGMVEFTVRDNGVGIAPEDRDRLFLPFSRVSPGVTGQSNGSNNSANNVHVAPTMTYHHRNGANTNTAPGCGLGLCLCRHLVHLMGGTIELSSVVDEGTIVTVRLPLQPICALAEMTDPRDSLPASPVHGRSNLMLPLVPSQQPPQISIIAPITEIRSRLYRSPSVMVTTDGTLKPHPLTSSPSAISTISHRSHTLFAARQRRQGSVHSARNLVLPTTYPSCIIPPPAAPKPFSPLRDAMASGSSSPSSTSLSSAYRAAHGVVRKHATRRSSKATGGNPSPSSPVQVTVALPGQWPPSTTSGSPSAPGTPSHRQISPSSQLQAQQASSSASPSSPDAQNALLPLPPIAAHPSSHSNSTPRESLSGSISSRSRVTHTRTTTTDSVPSRTFTASTPPESTPTEDFTNLLPPPAASVFTATLMCKSTDGGFTRCVSSGSGAMSVAAKTVPPTTSNPAGTGPLPAHAPPNHDSSSPTLLPSTPSVPSPPPPLPPPPNLPPPSPHALPPRAIAGSSFSSGPQPSLKCFIVDDHNVNLLLLKKMLQRILHCEVIVCFTALEVIQKISSSALATSSATSAVPTNSNFESMLAIMPSRMVLLTDIHMPEIDGLELTTELRRTFDLTMLPIFGVTADHTTQLHEDCLQCGMQAVITKPISCDQLLETMIHVLVPLWGDGVLEMVKR